MISEKLADKLLQRQVRLALAALEGVSSAKIVKPDPEEFAFHDSAVKEKCGIDAPASVRWNVPIDVQDVISRLAERIAFRGKTLFLPFESPYAIQVAIEDFDRFIRSVWRLTKSYDIVLYGNSPPVVYNVQDLEYEVAYFEIHR